MGTRSGSIDPGIPEFIAEKSGLDFAGVTALLQKKSGLMGISGLSSDLRDLMDAARDGNKRAQLAIDILVYQIKKQIGAFAAALGGLDAVVFTGGIGENADKVRERI